jgi:hypothetical protein
MYRLQADRNLEASIVQSLQKVVFGLLGVIALTPIAAGQPEPSLPYSPSGDVWIAPGATNFVSPVGDISTAPELPTGDIWPTPDDATRTAQPAAMGNASPARAGDASASRSISVAPKVKEPAPWLTRTDERSFGPSPWAPAD